MTIKERLTNAYMRGFHVGVSGAIVTHPSAVAAFMAGYYEGRDVRAQAKARACEHATLSVKHAATRNYEVST